MKNLAVKQESVEQEILKRGYELPKYDVTQQDIYPNGFSHKLVCGRYSLEWLETNSGKAYCFAVFNNEGSRGVGFRGRTLKATFDLFDKVTKE